MSILSSAYFHNEEAAFAYLEGILWPENPICPHCGSMSAKHYDLRKTRVGLRKCSDCKKQFTCKVGTVFESAHIPLNKMLQAVYLMVSSKKGISAHQLHRTLEITYKSAWFLAHRIREAMKDNTLPPIGGQNKVVEVDETYVGGKAKNRAFKEPPTKQAVVSLVEREGRVQSYHVANVTGKTLAPIIANQIDKATYIMTDESPVYPKIAKNHAGHGTVNHSKSEYVRAYFWHTNTVENYFSILKRGITGVYHHVSESHLHRYTAEFDFRYNNRAGLGKNDYMRHEAALGGIVGKRLTYRQTY